MQPVIPITQRGGKSPRIHGRGLRRTRGRPGISFRIMTVGAVREPLWVKPVCAATFRPGIGADAVRDALEGMFGPVEDRSDVFDFSFSRYYEHEMGAGLKKAFFSFRDPVRPGFLPGMKRRTNAFEGAWMEGGRRRINLDPGYITGAKLVLASTKDFAHRVYLGRGIYGDVQLRYVHGRFCTSEWTYPDYQTGPALSFFERVRETFVQWGKTHGRIPEL